jgi:hypothetical protein
MPVSNVAKEIYRLAMRDGHDTEDFSAVYEFVTDKGHPAPARGSKVASTSPTDT